MSISKHFVFHGEEMLAPCPTPKLEDHSLLAVRDCLFNLFAANLHIGGRSSVRNLRTRRAMVTDAQTRTAYNFTFIDTSARYPLVNNDAVFA